jgi:hypothetical protein
MKNADEKLIRLLAEIRSKGSRAKDEGIRSSGLKSILAFLEDAAKGRVPNKGSD